MGTNQKPRFDRSLTRPVPQLVGARRLRTLLLSDVDYLKGADARSPTAATPDATARHRPLRLPVMGLPPRYTVANRPLRPTFSNLDSALCTHVPPNMPPAYPPSQLATPRTSHHVSGNPFMFPVGVERMLWTAHRRCWSRLSRSGSSLHHC